MTNLQIQRNNWQEQVRHQLASEAELARHDAEMERLTGEANAETARANRAREQQQMNELEELKRHQRQSEAYSFGSLSESTRANMAREAENLRHDQRMENIDAFNVMSQDKRGWASLSLTEQLNASQIALNNAKTLVEDWNGFLLSYRYQIGMPDQEFAKLQAETARIMKDVNNADKLVDSQISKINSDIAYNEKIAAIKESEKNLKWYTALVNTVATFAEKILPLLPSGAPVPEF